jgi:CubicO group peptidase (beta-lactamase class C family)
MKKLFILLIVFGFVSAFPQTLYAQNIQLKLDTLVKRLGETFIKNQNAIGLSIGIYNNGNTFFYNFGSVHKDKKVLPTQNTVYEIGSITKSFISYILAKAVLENKVKLDDDIRKYLKGNFPNLEYNGSFIRLVHLANTTSLLPDWLPELPAGIKNLPADSALQLKTGLYSHLTKGDFLNALHTVKLDTIPGTRSNHSNAAAQLLAYILEDVYQMPIEKLLDNFLIHPYKLSGTGFLHSNKAENIATGYNSSGEEATYEFMMPYFKYAGGLGSTSHAMINFIRLFFDKQNAAASLCLKNTVDMDASTGKVIEIHADTVISPGFYSSALNWFKYRPDSVNTQIWSDGGTNGFNSYLVLYPQAKTGVIVLSNKSDGKIFNALPGIAYEISKAINDN